MSDPIKDSEEEVINTKTNKSLKRDENERINKSKRNHPLNKQKLSKVIDILEQVEKISGDWKEPFPQMIKYKVKFDILIDSRFIKDDLNKWSALLKWAADECTQKATWTVAENVKEENKIIKIISWYWEHHMKLANREFKECKSIEKCIDDIYIQWLQIEYDYLYFQKEYSLYDTLKTFELSIINHRIEELLTKYKEILKQEKSNFEWKMYQISHWLILTNEYQIRETLNIFDNLDKYLGKIKQIVTRINYYLWKAMTEFKVNLWINEIINQKISYRNNNFWWKEVPYKLYNEVFEFAYPFKQKAVFFNKYEKLWKVLMLDLLSLIYMLFKIGSKRCCRFIRLNKEIYSKV